MSHVRIKITLVLLLLATVGGYAQQTCYQIGLSEGREIYNEAQKLEKSGRCVEAVPRFWEALRRFRLTRSCRELPANHELDAWEDRCIQGVAACGGKTDETTFLVVSPRSLAFTEAGGDNSITINTNSSSWRVDKTPSWCTTRRSGNRLTVTCRANTGANGRSEKLVIVANTLSYEVTVEQAGKSTPETPAFASIMITDVKFAGKFADGTTKGYGDELANNMTFLLPRVTCDHLAMESKRIKLDVKILDPNGRPLSGSASGYTFSEEITLRGNHQKNDVFDVAEWGSGDGATFAATGKYTFEVWCSGVKMFSTAFEVFPKSVPPCERIKITGVQLKGKYADNTSGDFGTPLYNHMTYLLPRVAYTHLTEGGKTVKLDFRILDPSGNLLAPFGDTWSRELTIQGNLQQGDVFEAPERGSGSGAVFARTGNYRFEIWCSGVSLFSTSFEVLAKQETVPTSPPPVSPPIPSSSKLKASIGVKAGLNLANISNGMSDVDFSPEMKFDFHGGIFCNLNFGYQDNKPGFFSVQPEILYSRQGFAVDGNAINFDYATGLLMIKLNIYQGLNIEAGPYISYLLAVNPNSTLIDGNHYKLSDLKGGMDAGAAAGIGYDFNFGLVVGARYHFGLSDMAKNLLWTNRVISISLGWKF